MYTVLLYVLSIVYFPAWACVRFPQKLAHKSYLFVSEKHAYMLRDSELMLLSSLSFVVHRHFAL